MPAYLPGFLLILAANVHQRHKKSKFKSSYIFFVYMQPKYIFSNLIGTFIFSEQFTLFDKILFSSIEDYENREKAENNFKNVNAILMDLGWSSPQFEERGRGFSFEKDEPLDMRFAPGENDLTAGQILNEWPESEIEVILRENANERNARKIARAIVEQRKTKKFASTLDLTQLVMNVVPPRFGRARINPATKTFQALRMAVNDEIGNIQKFLSAVMEIMPSGCRLSVITFHSIEDRVVKDFFKLNSRDCLCPPEIPVCRCGHKAQLKLITHKPITPSEKEVQENFRARSAKLRVVEKT